MKQVLFTISLALVLLVDVNAQAPVPGNITGGGSGGGGGSGTVTNFAAPSGSWPTWFVPTVTNSTTTPSLAIAAGNIPVTALNSGTGASSSTFWRGDGTWVTPAGAGTVNAGTAGYLTYYATSTAAVSSNANLDDGVTTASTLTYTPSGGIAATQYTTTGTTPGAQKLVAGTGSIPALPANSAGFAAPATGGTAYLFKLPATATAGVLTSATPATADGVNESAVTVTGLQGTDTKVMTAGTITGTAASLCTDANGGATTSGCTSGGGSPSNYYQYPYVSGGGISITATNQIRLYDYLVSTPVTFSTLMFSWNVNDTLSCTAGANCYDIGIYDLSGNLKAHTGAISALSSSSTNVTISGGGTVTLQPGRYLMAFTGSATTARAGAGSGNLFIGQQASAPPESSTSGVLPSTVTVPSDSWTLSTIGAFLGLRN